MTHEAVELPVPAPAELSRAAAVWTRLAQLGIVLLALALRLWRLGQNGYGSDYYSAGVRSMSGGWHNFLYNSFDPGGFVSVDKPPVALWVQVASVKLFGFHGLSLLLPQVVEGVAAVWLVFHLAQRRFGAPTGLLAGLFLAITPVSVAIDRSSNTDSCLVLVLLLAAWALMRAAEEGSLAFLLLSMALVGLGFNVKMLAAFVVLPIFALVYFVGAPVGWRRRLVDLTMSGVVLAVVSLSWALAYDLTPPDKRPFAGSSRTNSMLELAVGHNAAERFVRRQRPFRAAVVAPGSGQAVVPGARPDAGGGVPAAGGFRRGRMGGMDRVPVGPLRLADYHLAGQVGWLFPLAVMGLALGASRARSRWPLSPPALALILWSGWVLSYGVVYSYAGGIFHAYYLSTMAPPLAALAGVGVTTLWSSYLRAGWRVILLPATLLVTAAWQTYIEAPALSWQLDGSRGRIMAVLSAAAAHAGDWRTWLLAALLVGTLAAAVALLVIRRGKAPAPPARGAAVVALTVGLVALLITPAAWALSTVLVRGNVGMPSADLSTLAPGAADAAPPFGRAGFTSAGTQKLVGFLLANRRRERFLLGASSARLAAPIIVATGEPVMARGGFFGGDPILTPESLARMAEAEQIRFVMLGDVWNDRRGPGDAGAATAVDTWIRANGTPVDPALWRSTEPAAVADGRRARGGGPGNMQLYDLRPAAGVVPGPAQ